MKKIVSVLSIILSVATLGFTVEENQIIDKNGNKIERKIYEKIVVMDPAVVESIYSIGGEDKIIAIADIAKSEIWPEEKTSKLPSAGHMMKPSIEKVLSFNPELVILNTVSSSFGDSLKERGIKYIVNDAKTFQEILENLKVYGIITGRESTAENIKLNYENKLEEIKSSIAKNPINQKGVFLFSTSPMMVFTKDSLPGEVLSVLGISNIADTLPGKRPILSSEFLIKSNPDIILGSMGINNPEDILKSNPIVGETSAGKNKNIKILDSKKILRATPRVIDALEELYKEILSDKKNS